MSADDVKPIGLHGCYCHPFNDWKECDAANKQKFYLGAQVKHRCTGQEFSVVKTRCQAGYVEISSGPLPRDTTIAHVSNLIPISQ